MRIPVDRDQLPLEEQTIAESFQASGYQTFYAGKWHLGADGHSPREQGFQYYEDPVGRSEAGSPAKNRFSYRPHASDWLTDRTIAFLESSAAKGPTFSVLSFYDVHTPIVAEQSMLEHFRQRLEGSSERSDMTEQAAKTRSRQDSPPYASMVHEVDHQVGRLLGTLERLGILDQSIVVFTSDNGGLSTLLKNPGPTSNQPLRAGKGWLYEGGIRVPLLIRLPDGEERILDTPLVTMDLFPTLLDLAGLPAVDTGIDGVSWKGTLLKDQPPPQRPLFWHYPHYHGSGWTGGSAVQHEGWKLIEFAEDGRKELFYLPEDPGESRNLAADKPEKLAELSHLLDQWRTSLDAGKMVPKEQPEAQ
jgi:arylsulfatase A-like enzyme